MLGGVGALLGLQDEAGALVEVYPARRGGAVRLAVGNATLIAVVPERAGSRIGLRDAEDGAEVVEERDVVRPLGLFRAVPTSNERADRVARSRAAIVWHRSFPKISPNRPCTISTRGGRSFRVGFCILRPPRGASLHPGSNRASSAAPDTRQSPYSATNAPSPSCRTRTRPLGSTIFRTTIQSRLDLDVRLPKTVT